MSTLVLGHRGMVGRAVVRHLQGAVSIDRFGTNLGDRNATNVLLSCGFDHVYLCAARVGGIKSNSEKPAEFIEENLRIQTNVIAAAYRYGVKKLMFLGSSCIYPKFATQPIPESELLTGPLEPTNQAYAVAKIAGIEMCRAYRKQYGFNAICAMPTNLYGPGDKYNDDGHVIPGLIRRFHEAKESGAQSVTVWGDGSARREFLHVDDLADALVLLMEKYEDGDPINVGCGADITIRELVHLIAEVVGFKGLVCWDHSKPNGTPRKLLDVTKITQLGWKPRIELADGLRSTYRAYCESLAVAA